MVKSTHTADKLILVVEDDVDIRDYLIMVLTTWGYQTIPAENGKDAVTLALASNPDIILMDAMMPGGSGVAAAQELKSDERSKRVPILFVTAMNSKLIGNSLEEFGEVLQKPFDSHVLRNKIGNILWPKDEEGA